MPCQHVICLPPSYLSHFQRRCFLCVRSVSHAVDFVLENFTEANRLWVRMHAQGGVKDKRRRERERRGV